MATHSSILGQRIPMNRGAWWAAVHGVAELDMIEWRSTQGYVSFRWTAKGLSHTGSSVHGISQGRILEWVVISYTRGSSWPRDWIATLESPALAGKFFTTRATWEAPICSNNYWLNYLTLFTLCAGLILVVRYMWPYNNLMIKLLLFLFYSKKSP